MYLDFTKISTKTDQLNELGVELQNYKAAEARVTQYESAITIENISGLVDAELLDIVPAGQQAMSVNVLSSNYNARSSQEILNEALLRVDTTICDFIERFFLMISKIVVTNKQIIQLATQIFKKLKLEPQIIKDRLQGFYPKYLGNHDQVRVEGVTLPSPKNQNRDIKTRQRRNSPLITKKTSKIRSGSNNGLGRVFISNGYGGGGSSRQVFVRGHSLIDERSSDMDIAAGARDSLKELLATYERPAFQQLITDVDLKIIRILLFIACSKRRIIEMLPTSLRRGSLQTSKMSSST